MKRIKQISVKNLFGLFDHTIPLNLEEHITIIHGPNGFGKTIILKLLKCLFNGSTHILRGIPFDEFRVDFDDDTSLWITKPLQPSHPSEEEEHSGGERITFHATGEKSFTLPSMPAITPSQLAAIDRTLPVEYVGAETWRDMLTSENLTLEQILERFGDHLPIEIAFEREKEPEWLIKARKAVTVRFIETQRLLNLRRSSRRLSARYDRYPPAMIPTVTMYAEELAETIKTNLAESSALSQSLDRTFPARVVNPTARERRIAESELRNKLAELERKRSHLIEDGLLDQGSSDTVQVSDRIDETMNPVLSIYIEDTEKKLGIFDDIASKIDLLKRIINKRFLYKDMTISRQDGFVFTTSKGTNLPLENLSSGEQHELVLFYELLFKIAPGSLVLIDEPEISLHVVWQQQFLEDVQEITRITGIDILMATHSPDVINNHWDLTIQLEGPRG